MANRRNGLLPHLRRIVLAHDLAGLPDAQLLNRFQTNRDEEAFAALVRRHGPMVLAVGRRLLASPFDVDDAFQATFLVLVRKAGSIRRPEQLGNWLYGVAYRTALKARTRFARQRAMEQPLIDVPAPDAVAEVVWRELRPILDAEQHRLPDRLRIPVVLCYLQGRTKRQAALQLGLPEGTVSSRLHEARARLRRRLAHRGLELSAGTLAIVLTHGTAAATLPPALAATTAKSASVFAVGVSSTLSVSVLSLAQGVLGVMTMTKLKVITAVLIAVSVIGAGVGGLVYRTQAAEVGGKWSAVVAQVPNPGGAATNPDQSGRAAPVDPNTDQLNKERIYNFLLGEQLQRTDDQQVQELQKQLDELQIQQQVLEERRRLFEAALKKATDARKLLEPHRHTTPLSDIEQAIKQLKGCTFGDKAKQSAVADFEKAFQKLKGDLQGKGGVPIENLRNRKPAEGVLNRDLLDKPEDVRIQAGEALKRLEDQRIEMEQLFKQLKEQGRAQEAEQLLRKILEEGSKPKPQPEGKSPAPADLQGVVKNISQDGNLVEISIGSDDGLQRGHTLEVFRLKPQPAYLGIIRIVETRAKDAVGVSIRPEYFGQIQAGDQVGSKSVPPQLTHPRN